MSGNMGMLLAAGGSVTAPPAMTYSTAKAGAALTSTVTFNTVGTVVGSTTGTSTLADTTHSWFTPPLTGAGNLYFLKITPTVGTLTTNGAAAFTALSGAIAITRNAALGVAQSCTYTVQIATDIGGVNIVSTQTGNIIAADGT